MTVYNEHSHIIATNAIDFSSLARFKSSINVTDFSEYLVFPRYLWEEGAAVSASYWALLSGSQCDVVIVNVKCYKVL